MEMKVYGMGKKLGLYLPKEFIEKHKFRRGEDTLIEIKKNKDK